MENMNDILLQTILEKLQSIENEIRNLKTAETSLLVNEVSTMLTNIDDKFNDINYRISNQYQYIEKWDKQKEQYIGQIFFKNIKGMLETTLKKIDNTIELFAKSAIVKQK